MIIRYPTGLYKSVLPVNPGDGGNVTYLISDTDPPRAELLFPKLPDGIDQQQRQPPLFDFALQRGGVGELVYTVSQASKAVSGNNAQQYQIGQVLDFANTTTQFVDPMLVGQVTEIQHNLNILDYAQLGLTDGTVQTLGQTASTVYDMLTAQLNRLKQARANSDSLINTYQKTLNEIQQAISAIQAVITNTPDTGGELNQTLANLQQMQIDTQATLNQQIVVASTQAIQADGVLATLRQLAAVVQ